MKAFGGAAAAVVAMLVLILSIGVMGSTQTAAACGQGGSSTVTLPPGLTVDGFTPEQLGNAATIMNVAAQRQLPTQAQLIGVMTAMGESSLVNIDYGDGAINPDGSVADSIGLFQQQSSWGTVQQRMDPAAAAGLFYDRLVNVPDWSTLPPSRAAHAVQRNADPDHYTKYVDGAQRIVDALTGAVSGAPAPSGGAGPTGAPAGAGGCAVSGDAVALAQELVAAVDAGKLVGSTPDHIKEIRWIAEGQTVPDCGVDVRILQIIVIAVRSFDNVGVSDINRKCTGQIEGAGTASSHYINGGGHAVDFYRLNGHSLTGADDDSIKLIQILDPIVPTGTNVGQSSCRAAAGISLQLVHLQPFDDTCNHFHIDVGHTDGSLTPGGLLS
ncbi:hypothetical protein GCM10010988_41340 [Cnuibacter physcomitrellae]|nr:hypothetical protein [Cnuibacter physcomitrellae]GGI42898.1 hypothetical protein GCM10010988_41340 [Cnuibacter physcomitrellae]